MSEPAQFTDQRLRAYKIAEIRQENSVNKTFLLDGNFEARPGQFVMAWLPGMQDKPFSLSGVNPISLTVAAVGPLSRALHQLAVGDSLWIRGPFGNGYQLPPAPMPGTHLLLIGGGYGVAPLLFLAKMALTHQYRISVIIGAGSSADLLLTNEFEALGISVWLTTEDGSAGQRGVATDVIPAVLAAHDRVPATIYACGPTGLLRAVARQCVARNIPVQISWEAHMRCSIGLCGSCEVGAGWLTCLDGPVFRFDPEQISPLAPL